MAALVTLVVGLFAAVTILSALAQRLQIPAAILLVLGGGVMITLLSIVLLVVVAGWLDSRLNWRQAERNMQEDQR